MNQVKLRDYQENAVTSVVQDVQKQNHSLLVIAPTGAGKTILIAKIIQTLLELNLAERVLVLVDKIKINNQNIEKFAWATNNKIESGICQGANKDLSKKVVFATPQTAGTDATLPKIKKEKFDLVVIDECHHAFHDIKSTSSKKPHYQKILEQLKPKNLIGFTATPSRNDNKKLSDVFKKVSYRIELDFLIDRGYLVEPEGHIAQVSDYSIDDLKILNTGEYSNTQLDKTFKTQIAHEEIFEHWFSKASKLKTIFFCYSIAHAKELCTFFKEQDINSSAIYSGLSEHERARILKEFSTGKIQCLFNVFVLAEGFDEPSIECIAIVKPTTNKNTFIQMVGRGLRPCKNKMKCLILDFGQSSLKHGNLNLGFDEAVLKFKKKKDTKKEQERIEEQKENVVFQSIKSFMKTDLRDRFGNDKMINFKFQKCQVSIYKVCEDGKYFNKMLIIDPKQKKAISYRSANNYSKVSEYYKIYELDSSFFGWSALEKLEMLGINKNFGSMTDAQAKIVESKLSKKKYASLKALFPFKIHKDEASRIIEFVFNHKRAFDLLSGEGIQSECDRSYAQNQ